MFQLNLSGAPFAISDVAAPLPPGKPLALLAYLACAPTSSATRTRLVDLLWSDVDLDSGKHALRQTLWYIKKKLGDGLILAENDHLKLAPGYRCDRTDFLAAIDCGDLEAAVELYTGPFFPNFASPGGAEFERWADVERAHLCAKFVRAAEDVCRRWLHKGNTRPAIALARRARDADDENESLWRLVLECLLAASDRIGAASEADALLRKLTEDEREPEVATNALLRAARAVDNAKNDGTDARATLFAELVGREQEFSRIISGWERARDGVAAHIHLTAPAGLGKTRLISDVEARLRASRARVVKLRAAPGERQMPYALAAELAASLAKLRGAAGVSPGAASTLLALNPSVSTWLAGISDTTNGDDGLRRRSLALSELLAAVSAETPVVLLIDDLHWIDRESQQLLISVAGRLQSVPVLLVTASRPPSPFPADGTGTETIPLIPLDSAQVGAMVASIATLPDEAWADALSGELHSATGGSPLLVLEMLQYALDHQRLTIEDGCWHCSNNDELILDLRPGRAVERRVAALDGSARKVLLSLALAGVPMSSAMLAQVLARSEHDAEATLARLEQSGLVLRDGASWLPQHDEIAAAAVAAADEKAQRETQRGLANAFRETSPRDIAVLRRSLSHAIAAGDDALIANICRQYIEVARMRGDSRRALLLLRDALGPDIAQSMVQGLNATLPLPERFSFREKARSAFFIAAAATAIVAAGIWIQNNRPVAENTLLVQIATDSETTLREFEVFDSEMDSDLPISVDQGEVAAAELRAIAEWGNPHERLDRGAWVGWADLESGGSTTPELVMKIGTRELQRLASSPEDDINPVWAPDGKTVIFSTRNWAASPERKEARDLDLARIDVSSGNIVQLSRSTDYDGRPFVSPFGTRIAFARTDVSGALAICLMTLDGKDVICRPLAGFAAVLSTIWRGNDEVLVAVTPQNGYRSALLRWSISADEIFTLHDGAINYEVSPDGHLVLFEQQDPGTATVRRYLAATEHMERRRMLTSAGTIRKTVWRATRRKPRSPESIKIGERSNPVAIGIPSQLETQVLDAQRDVMSDALIAYTSLDTTLATVTRRGVVTGTKAGTVRIVAAADPHLRDTVLVSIAPLRHEALWEEHWTAGISPAWRVWGIPEPIIVVAESGRSAVFVRGDGNYASGLFSVKPIDASSGAGLEIQVSTPLDRTVWKSFSVTFEALPDSQTLRKFKNTDFGIPAAWHDASRDAYCGMGVPATEGAGGVNSIGLNASAQLSTQQIPPAMADGSWHRWRIQVFPDGRCGFAIDGVALWISDRAIVSTRPLSVVIGGQSVNTKILAGPLTTWTGVVPGVDWTKLGFGIAKSTKPE